MLMIEGVGDEVIQFCGVVIIVGIALIAWWSTSISEGPLIRTVLILERRRRTRSHTRSRTNDAATQPSVTVTDDENAIDTGQDDPTNLPELVETEPGSVTNDDDKDENESGSSLLLPETQQPPTVQPVGNDSTVADEDTPLIQPIATSESTQSEPQIEIEPTQDVDNLTATSGDADSSILRKRRLAFFQSRGPTLIEPSDTVESEPDSVPTANAAPEEASSNSPDQIRIRLKYLNDSQTVVEGRLQEQLGDFKRRHFRIELAAEKMVRLIFNGQVLQSDNQTLQGYGLFDNCVVHCLVHSQRNNTPRSTQSHANGGSNQSTPPDWNLGTLLYTCLSVILGFAWYCRYQYSHLFTVTTTAALFGLTSMFAVTLLSIYLPDQDTIQ